jgi:hypothetical protein
LWNWIKKGIYNFCLSRRQKIWGGIKQYRIDDDKEYTGLVAGFGKKD